MASFSRWMPALLISTVTRTVALGHGIDKARTFRQLRDIVDDVIRPIANLLDGLLEWFFAAAGEQLPACRPRPCSAPWRVPGPNLRR